MDDLAELDESRLRRDSADIEGLLEEAHTLCPPAAWQRVEEAVRRILRLYGAGLAHVLDHARTAGAVGATFEHLIGDDELLESLLVLHELHPLGTEERVRRALGRLLARHGLALELAGIADGVAYLEAAELPDPPGQALIRRAIEAAAPELSSIELATIAA